MQNVALEYVRRGNLFVLEEITLMVEERDSATVGEMWRGW
jgi:hypothetical protein